MKPGNAPGMANSMGVSSMPAIIVAGGGQEDEVQPERMKLTLPPAPTVAL